MIYLFLLIGCVGMFISVFIQSFKYKICLWKSIVIALALTVFGTLGAMLMFFVENGYFDGFSFFGAIFLIPIVFYPLALLIREKYSNVMDSSAPAGCVILIIMRVNCIRSNCCRGMSLYMAEDGSDIRFPVREAEITFAVILCVLLIILSYKGKLNGILYPAYMISYGVGRFILNCFRMEFYTTDMILPFGNIWAIVSVVTGIIWIIFFKRYKDKSQI